MLEFARGNGALCESVVAEALAKSGYGLYYKRENSTLEEDFFVRTWEHLVPVEVKLTAGNVGFENSVLTMPYFAAFLIRRLLAAFDSSETA